MIKITLHIRELIKVTTDRDDFSYMENFNLRNLTNSMINQLNSSLDIAKKSNTHLQTGK